MWILRQPTSPEEIEAYFDLRWRVLREPWDQPRGSERDELESIAKHVGAYVEEGRLAGVGRLHVSNQREAQLRYMAVEDESRGKGVGREIVEQLESIAQSLDIERITLNSRDSAVEFYQRLGYRVTGAGPTLFDTIKHQNMAKNVQSQTGRNE